MLRAGSDTYHAWTLIGVRNYYIYSGDTQFLSDIWPNLVKAVGFLEGKVHSRAHLCMRASDVLYSQGEFGRRAP